MSTGQLPSHTRRSSRGREVSWEELGQRGLHSALNEYYKMTAAKETRPSTRQASSPRRSSLWRLLNAGPLRPLPDAAVAARRLALAWRRISPVLATSAVVTVPALVWAASGGIGVRAQQLALAFALPLLAILLAADRARHAARAEAAAERARPAPAAALAAAYGPSASGTPSAGNSLRAWGRRLSEGVVPGASDAPPSSAGSGHPTGHPRPGGDAGSATGGAGAAARAPRGPSELAAAGPSRGGPPSTSAAAPPAPAPPSDPRDPTASPIPSELQREVARLEEELLGEEETDVGPAIPSARFSTHGAIRDALAKLSFEVGLPVPPTDADERALLHTARSIREAIGD